MLTIESYGVNFDQDLAVLGHWELIIFLQFENISWFACSAQDPSPLCYWQGFGHKEEGRQKGGIGNQGSPALILYSLSSGLPHKRIAIDAQSLLIRKAGSVARAGAFSRIMYDLATG